jgi:hypothetical protein
LKEINTIINNRNNPLILAKVLAKLIQPNARSIPSTVKIIHTRIPNAFFQFIVLNHVLNTQGHVLLPYGQGRRGL